MNRDEPSYTSLLKASRSGFPWLNASLYVALLGLLFLGIEVYMQRTFTRNRIDQQVQIIGKENKVLEDKITDLKKRVDALDQTIKVLDGRLLKLEPHTPTKKPKPAARPRNVRQKPLA
jgi:hypothetical protein